MQLSTLSKRGVTWPNGRRELAGRVARAPFSARSLHKGGLDSGLEIRAYAAEMCADFWRRVFFLGDGRILRASEKKKPNRRSRLMESNLRC
jgi:hypothetical protein